MATILVVDDAALDRSIAGACVEAEGSKPIYATNGREALDIISRDLPDAVLTDLRMSEIDGLQLVKHVRENHPGIPVMLMTAHGSEEVAVKALHAGAVSYIPKKTLKQNLGEAMRTVFAAIDEAADRMQVRELLEASESRFVVGYEPTATRALISYLQDDLKRVGFCDSSSLLQVSTALTEALTNAIDHGNLELDSKLREAEDNSYRNLGNERATRLPYRDRRVYLTARLTSDEASYTIRDEGPGFDPDALPDPTDPEYILRPSGRGVLLIRTFMDEVAFNDAGNEITMIKRLSKS